MHSNGSFRLIANITQIMSYSSGIPSSYGVPEKIYETCVSESGLRTRCFSFETCTLIFCFSTKKISYLFRFILFNLKNFLPHEHKSKGIYAG